MRNLIQTVYRFRDATSVEEKADFEGKHVKITGDIEMYKEKPGSR
jgi:hypothetical protein